jgi:hypothetical protein
MRMVSHHSKKSALPYEIYRFMHVLCMGVFCPCIRSRDCGVFPGPGFFRQVLQDVRLNVGWGLGMDGSAGFVNFLDCAIKGFIR